MNDKELEWATADDDKDCYCYTCERGFHHLGVARHRAKHRDNGENCRIQYSDGRITFYNYEGRK